MGNSAKVKPIANDIGSNPATNIDKKKAKIKQLKQRVSLLTELVQLQQQEIASLKAQLKLSAKVKACSSKADVVALLTTPYLSSVLLSSSLDNTQPFGQSQELAPELVTLIIQKLQTTADLLCVSRVCKQLYIMCNTTLIWKNKVMLLIAEKEGYKEMLTKPDQTLYPSLEEVQAMVGTEDTLKNGLIWRTLHFFLISALPIYELSRKPRVIALYDYTGQNDELSFKEGNLITILDKDSGGWWKGELDGKIGWLPANYVEYETLRKK